MLPTTIEGDEVKIASKKLPVEFFSQAWSKVREVDHTSDVLKFNDHFASTRGMEHLQHAKAIVEEVKIQMDQN